MKKLLRLTLPVILLLILLVIPVSAQSVELYMLEQRILDSFLPENTAGTVGVRVNDKVIYGNTIYVQDLELTPEQIFDYYSQMRSDGQLPWYALGGSSWSYDSITGIANTFTPYVMDPAVCDRTAYEREIAEILDATVFEGMDQWQAALSVHDYLITHCIYDESLVLNTNYDLLINGSTVCDGYARAYMDLMNRIGIPCVTIGSEEMNHAWNLINLYGNWYHVDVTWDDPVSDTYGQVLHDHFLLTDEEISSNHYGWETDIICTDTTYQDAFWRGVDSAITYISNEYSYYRYVDTANTWQNYTVRRTEATGELTLLNTAEPKYFDLGTGQYYCYYHNSLSLWNGRLYANTMDSVYSMNLDGSDVRTEFIFDVYGNKQYIRACFVEDGCLYICLSDHGYNKTPLVLSLDPASYSAYHTHDYTTYPFEPSCTQCGYSSFLCECGVSFDGDYTAPLGHTFDEGVIILEPTVSEPGIKELTCFACGEVIEEEIAPLASVVTEPETQEPSYSYEPTEEEEPASRKALIIGAIILFVVVGINEKKKKKK